MSEQLISSKLVELITLFELDRNTLLKDVVATGDSRGSKNRKIRALESLTQQVIMYNELKKSDEVVEPVV